MFTNLIKVYATYEAHIQKSFHGKNFAFCWADDDDQMLKTSNNV